MHRDDFLHTLCTDEPGVFDFVAAKSRDLGFEYCAFGMKLPLPLAAPQIVLRNDYSDAWRCQYEKQGYLGTDPVVQHGLRSDSLLVWSSGLFNGAQDLWEDANAHGLSQGIGQARRLTNGTVGMLNLSRSADKISLLEVRKLSQEIEIMTEMLVVAEARATTARHIPESLQSLNSREKEILQWTADGKTSSEIGQILSISTATVNFHINRTLVKLNSVNKTQAAVKATILGML
jgi:LuxR family transcriptional regulator